MTICTDEWGKNTFSGWNSISDGNWHYFVWHFNHSTGTLELFIDGVSAANTNVATAYPGTGWDSAFGISFGGNITNGGGGVNEMWTKYDDIIIATTKTEVENFLGIGTQVTTPQDNISPASPSGVNVQIVP